ncbi:MAG TPA: c-type cytochrome [Longimicrobiales bacterium]|nr:c-type cytochrome [Longimicrobiales bacterium]
MRGDIRVLGVAAAVLLGGCEEHEFHPPDRAERVAAAESVYSAAAFDSVTWASIAERRDAGNLVYADECRRCHGPYGRGDTEYARGRELRVPSLVRPDWPEGDDVDAVRRRVFVGHPAGMTSWGIGHLTLRQIDAAAFYIAAQLRPEVLGDSGTVPAR